MEISKLSAFLEKVFQRDTLVTANVDETVIRQEILENDAVFSNITIKVLTVLGGIIAAVFFFLFLGISGAFNTGFGRMMVGSFSLAIAVYLFNSNKGLFWETLGVMLSIVAHVSLYFGLSEFSFPVLYIYIIFVIVAFVMIAFADNYLQKMASVMIIFCGLPVVFDDFHIWGFVPILGGLVSILMTYFILFEAKLVAKSPFWASSYAPIRMGILLSFSSLIGLDAFNWMFKKSITFHIPYVGSILILMSLSYLLYCVFKKYKIPNSYVYIIGVMILFIPLIHNPAILGSFLVLLLGFYAQYRIDMAIGLLGLIYFVSRFYYDLNYDLLTKSYLMMGTGVLFLLGYGIFMKLESK